MAVTVSFNFFPRRPKSRTTFTTFQANNLPRGSKVVARCVNAKGKKCKGRLGKTFTKNGARGSLKLGVFKKRYPAGSQLEVIVTNAGFVTQIKIVKVRKNKIPLIQTRCQTPGASARRTC
jgi:hypothetical protein